MKNKFAVVVLCRLNSTRLLNKALLPLSKFSAIQRCLLHCLQSNLHELVILATSTDKEDTQLGLEVDYLNLHKCHRKSVLFFQGNANPAARLLEISKHYELQHIVRVTGDSPLISSQIIDKLSFEHLLSESDFTYSNDPPIGTRCEVIKVAALERLCKIIDTSQYGEYLALYFKNNTNIFKVSNIELPDYKIDARLSLDYPEDYVLLKHIFESFGEIIDIKDLLSFLTMNTHLLNINNHLVPKYESPAFREVLMLETSIKPRQL